MNDKARASAYVDDDADDDGGPLPPVGVGTIMRNDSLEVRGCRAGVDEAAKGVLPDPYGYASDDDERFRLDKAGDRGS